MYKQATQQPPPSPISDLFLYVKAGDLYRVQVYLENYRDNLNLADENGDTLITAVLRSEEIKTEQARLALIQLLHSHRVDINMPESKTQMTPLHIAVQKRFHSIVRYLMANEDTIGDSRDALRKQPIHYVVHCDLSSTYSAEEILQDSSPMKLLQAKEDKQIENDVLQDLGKTTSIVLSSLRDNKQFNILRGILHSLHEASWADIFKEDPNVRHALEEVDADITMGKDEKRSMRAKVIAEAYSALVESAEAYFRSGDGWKLFESNDDAQEEAYQGRRKKYVEDLHEHSRKLDGLEYPEAAAVALTTLISKNMTSLSVETIRTAIALGDKGPWGKFKNLVGLRDHKKYFIDVERLMAHPRGILSRGHVMDFESQLFIRGHTYAVFLSRPHVDPVERPDQWTLQEWFTNCIDPTMNFTNTFANLQYVYPGPPEPDEDRYLHALAIVVAMFPSRRQECLESLYAKAGFGGIYEDKYLESLLEYLYTRKDLHWKAVFWCLASVLLRTNEEIRWHTRDAYDDPRLLRCIQLLGQEFTRIPLEEYYDRSKFEIEFMGNEPENLDEFILPGGLYLNRGSYIDVKNDEGEPYLPNELVGVPSYKVKLEGVPSQVPPVPPGFIGPIPPPSFPVYTSGNAVPTPPKVPDRTVVPPSGIPVMEDMVVGGIFAKGVVSNRPPPNTTAVRESPIVAQDLDLRTKDYNKTAVRRNIRTSLTYSFVPRLQSIVTFFDKSRDIDFSKFIQQKRRFSASLENCRDIHDLHRILEIDPKVKFPSHVDLLKYYRKEVPRLWEEHPEYADSVYTIALLSKSNSDIFRVRSAAFDVEDVLQTVLSDREKGAGGVIMIFPPPLYQRIKVGNDVLNQGYNAASANNIGPCYLERFKLGDLVFDPARGPIIPVANRFGFVSDIDGLAEVLLLIICLYLCGFSTSFKQGADTLTKRIFDACRNQLNMWTPTVPIIQQLPTDIQAILAFFCDAVFGVNPRRLGQPYLFNTCPEYLKDVITSSQTSPSMCFRYVFAAYGVHPVAIDVLMKVVGSYREAKTKYDKDVYIANEFIETFYAVSYAHLLGLHYGGRTQSLPPPNDTFEGDEQDDEQQLGPPPFGLYDQIIGDDDAYNFFFVPTGNALKNSEVLELMNRPSRLDCAINALAAEIAQRFHNLARGARYVQNMLASGQPLDFVYPCAIGPMLTQIKECENLVGHLEREWGVYKTQSKLLYDRFKSLISQSHGISADIETYYENRLQTILKAPDDRGRDVMVRGAMKDSAPLRLNRALEDLTKKDGGLLYRMLERLRQNISCKAGLDWLSGKAQYFTIFPPYIDDMHSISFLKRPYNYQTPLAYGFKKGEYSTDIIVPGSRVLALLKEDVIDDISAGYPSDRARRKIADKIVIQYLRHLLRHAIFRVVTRRYGMDDPKKKEAFPRLEDLEFYPKLKVDYKELQFLYSPYYQLDNTQKISYKLPWDYYSTAQDWEYRLPHYVMENSSVISLINRLRQFVAEKDDQECTVIHHLIETGNYHVLSVFQNRHVQPLGIQNMLDFAKARYNLHRSISRVHTPHLMELTILQMVEPLFRETCLTVSTEEFGFANLNDLQALYTVFGSQVVKLIEEPMTGFSQAQFFEEDESFQGVDSVLDTYYETSSPSCVLRGNSPFYEGVKSLIRKFLRKFWKPAFLTLAKLRMKTEATLKGIEKDFVRIVLGPPSDTSIDLLMEDVRLKLMPSSEVAAETHDHILRYAKSLAMRVMFDLRSIATNLMRLYINTAIQKKITMVIVR